MRFSRGWLGQYVELPAGTAELAQRLTFAGFTVEGIERLPAPEDPADPPDGPGEEVLEIDVTTNRPDCMCHLGLARELAVLFEQPLIAPPRHPGPREALALSVEVEDESECPRYVARLVEGVRIGPSPPWLVGRLAAIGLRSINNVVDVTNFVLWEMGQPLHAYDLDRLAGPRLAVRRGRPHERLVTLDGEERQVDADTLVIADAERPVGLAGIMGGRDSEVSAGTTRLLLEGACFDRRLVRQAAKRLGLHTDASHRFERGTDREICRLAVDRAAALIVELAGGRALGVADRRAAAPPARRGRLALDRLQAFAGAAVPAADAARWLRGLGFGLQPVAGGTAAPAVQAATAGLPVLPAVASGDPGGTVAWEVEVPSWRWYDFDPDPEGRVYEADLFEEVLRIFGFERIPAALPALPGADGPRTAAQRARERVRRFLAGAGFAEAINFGFEDPAAAAGLPTLRPGVEPLALLNPLSERTSVLRQSLLGNLIESARFNQRRGAAAVRLFEVAGVFFARPGGLPDEPEHVALVCGGRVGSAWDREVALDLFDLKGVVEGLAAALGVCLVARPAVLPGMLAGSAAELLDRDGRVAGLLGRLAVEEGYPLYAAEVEMAAFLTGDRWRQLDLPPRVPGVTADLTLTHPLRVTWSDIAAAVEALRPPGLTGFALKARYQGEGVPAGAVNTTLTFHYNAGDRTLTQDEVNERQLGLAAELAHRFAPEG
jgi:phenylalanyl-tRNA synthetase beta chain